jgi:hypothetical protein
MKGQILIQSWPTIRQGKRILVGRGNHWTDSGVYDIMRLMFSNYGSASNYDYYSPFYGTYHVIGIGLDQSTPTNPTMTALVSAKSYKPDSRQFVEFVKEADGQYRGKVQCMWNANHFSAPFVIGEVGLWYDSNPPSTDTATPGDSGVSSWFLRNIDGSKMKARASVADGTLQAFTVDSTLALIVEWTVRMAWKV